MLTETLAAFAVQNADLTQIDWAILNASLERDLPQHASTEQYWLGLELTARSYIEQDADYQRLATRLLLQRLYREALNLLSYEPSDITLAMMAERYAVYFEAYCGYGLQSQQLDPRLQQFDIPRLANALVPERDLTFTYLGLHTLYDRYLLHTHDIRYELPQALWMRVAMGLAINEDKPTERALQFYDLLSRFDFMCSTPTLFNAGTRYPQLSSCYLSSIPDDLNGIFSALRDNALLSKFAGGLGNDWTNVRALGAPIKGTNGLSQGVVPFLKVANDAALAVNQGGKRKGAVCAYLELWHSDIEEFLELRKNTGDDRRRTHDMHTAVWVPDLFMQRLECGESWTLFSPDEVPDLHDLYGPLFAERYLEYEAASRRGELRLVRTIDAKTLWRRILSMLYETGHPWITFKDPCNIRSPQQHCGVIHGSNLCTEITLNTDEEEIAVCNLGSVNLAAHIEHGQLQLNRLRQTVRTALRMLDNVIDLNLYMVESAQRANIRHRPVGLGMMGFQDALYRLRLPYASDAAIEFADYSAEALSYYAIEASTDLAQLRGCYSSYSGSLWSRGILPIDSLRMLAAVRADGLQVPSNTQFDWNNLRLKVLRHGMRNSNCLAIAPTATISNICGVSPSIEPTFQNLYVKSNLSGEFTIINPYLQSDLKQLGLWDTELCLELKRHDGQLSLMTHIPAHLRQLYACAFEIDPHCLIKAAARRQKWLDQAQSLNLYLAHPSGPALDALYRHAWHAGLKTTYYLRTRAATHVERSTVFEQRLNAVQYCDLDNITCEACQ